MTKTDLHNLVFWKVVFMYILKHLCSSITIHRCIFHCKRNQFNVNTRPANNIFISGRMSLKSNNFCKKALMRVLEFRVFDMIALLKMVFNGENCLWNSQNTCYADRNYLEATWVSNLNGKFKLDTHFAFK